MKSQANALLHVVSGLFKDIRSAYPALKGLDLDEKRFTLYCQTRGLTLFTLDLPHLDSLLLQGLEWGSLSLSGPLSKRVSQRIQVPRLLSGLWLLVFDRNACLKQDVDITALYFLRQVLCLGKKISVECSKSRRDATMKGYHNVERELRLPTLDWVGDELYSGRDVDDQHLADHLRSDPPFSSPELPLSPQGEEEGKEREEIRELLTRCQQVADIVVRAIGPFDPIRFSSDREEMSRGTGFRHGPGAVSEQLKQHEKSRFPSWPDKLQIVFPYSLTAITAGCNWERPQRHEVASRLIMVPKTSKGPRLIACEPVAHQYCQQSIRNFLVERVDSLFKGYFINFSRQSLSGDLVLKASLSRDLATVDLSDASDRLSCWVVERIFRTNPSLLSALHSARTRMLRDDVSDHCEFLLLKKFATQGTATTFPVQSLVFLILALASCIEGTVTIHKIWKLRNQVRVFGDDIIIPTRGYARLVAIMGSLQLKVNMAKSYVNGHFRESCGVDGYKGYDVTPVKPKTLLADSPASSQAVVDTINNLFVKGNWNASDSLRATLPIRVQRGLRIVAKLGTGYAGLISYHGSDESHLKKRWNPRLHRYEVQVWSVFKPTLARDRQGYDALLEFFGAPHNREQARIVSEERHSRKTRDRFLWEPSDSGARGHPLACENVRLSTK